MSSEKEATFYILGMSLTVTCWLRGTWKLLGLKQRFSSWTDESILLLLENLLRGSVSEKVFVMAAAGTFSWEALYRLNLIYVLLRYRNLSILYTDIACPRCNRRHACYSLQNQMHTFPCLAACMLDTVAAWLPHIAVLMESLRATQMNFVSALIQYSAEPHGTNVRRKGMSNPSRYSHVFFLLSVLSSMDH